MDQSRMDRVRSDLKKVEALLERVYTNLQRVRTHALRETGVPRTHPEFVEQQDAAEKALRAMTTRVNEALSLRVEFEQLREQLRLFDDLHASIPDEAYVEFSTEKVQDE